MELTFLEKGGGGIDSSGPPRLIIYSSTYRGALSSKAMERLGAKWGDHIRIAQSKKGDLFVGVSPNGNGWKLSQVTNSRMGAFSALAIRRQLGLDEGTTYRFDIDENPVKANGMTLYKMTPTE